MAAETRFITFATGIFELSADRLGRQVAEFPQIQEFRKYTMETLKSDPEFWSKHGTFILSNSKGVGYWLWKPYLVLQNLDEMNDGDTLIYADAGCYLQTTGQQRLEELIQLSRQHPSGIVAFNSEQPNCALNKADVFALGPPGVEEKTQIVATAFIVTKNADSQKFFQEFYARAQEDNYHLLTDAPSRTPNHPTFQTHRHDQSIFTMLAYKYNIYITPTDETWDGPAWEDKSKPIYAARRRGY